MKVRHIPGPAGGEAIQNRGEDIELEEDKEKTAMPSSWLSLRKALGLDQDNNHPTLSSVINGDYDLRLAHIVVAIDNFQIYCDGSLVLSLKDETGVISAIVSSRDAKRVTGLCCIGASILLENVSIFVNRCPFYRVLNIHPKCVKAIFASAPSLS